MDQAQEINKFETLNRLRIERLNSLFPAKNQFFLDSLPLLFQTNSELLPGYNGTETPAGIVDYQPTNKSLDAAKRINHSFQYKRHTLHHYSIRGLYLVNDQDSFSYHAHSKFELWLIYTQPLERDLYDLLKQKLDDICKWAKASLDITLHPHLHDQDDLANNSLSLTELDRFYHSGLCLAGSIPSWWMTAPDGSEETNEHPHPLQSYKKEILNFGSLTPVDPLSLVQQAFQAIDKAMIGGLKDCLDLIYFDTVLKSYPSFTWLSDQIKKRLYDQITQPTELEPNTLKLHVITESCHDKQAVFLAQQALYVLCKERLSKTVSNAIYPWRRNFIEQHVSSWQWDDSTIEGLDQRNESHYRECLSEYLFVKEYIKKALSTTKSFAKQHNLDITSYQYELENKFKSLFESSIDQIPQLAPPFIPKNHEERLFLNKDTVAENWSIDNLPNHLSKKPLYQHKSLLNVLTWAIQNHLLDKTSRLKIADKTHQVTMRFVLDLVQHLLRTPLTEKISALNSTPESSSDEITRVLLFSNLEHEPVSTLNQQGFELSSLQVDPLNYANNKHNFVASVEGLVQSSNGKWYYFIHVGKAAILEMLSTIIRWEPRQDSSLKTSCWCPTDNHGVKIQERIERIYEEVITHYNNYSSRGEYLIKIADLFYKIQWQQGICEVVSLLKGKSLLANLSSDRSNFVATQVDCELDKSQLLHFLLSHQHENKISLFILPHKQFITFYIIDDFGNLFKQQVRGLTASTLISHFHQFLNASCHSINSPNIEAFHLNHTDNNQWKTSNITPDNKEIKQSYLPVTIEMDSLKEDAHCIIHCGSKNFSGPANDPEVFAQVKQLVLRLRSSNNYYPLYITKLAFNSKQYIATRHYILQKQRLEYLLNRD